MMIKRLIAVVLSAAFIANAYADAKAVPAPDRVKKG